MSGRNKKYDQEGSSSTDLTESYSNQHEKTSKTRQSNPLRVSQDVLKAEQQLSPELPGTETQRRPPQTNFNKHAYRSKPDHSTTKSKSQTISATTSKNVTIGKPRVRPIERTPKNSTSRRTTTQRRLSGSSEDVNINTQFSPGTAESRLRKFLTPYYPDKSPPVRAASLSPVRTNTRRNSNSSLPDNIAVRDSDNWQAANNMSVTARWQTPNITRKSILRHSIGIDNPRRYEETVDCSSSNDSLRSDRRVRFEDQIRVKRKVAPSPQLIDLVRSDSETSLTSSSSGNLQSTSEVSVSSGTGSLQDYQLVGYSLGPDSRNFTTRDQGQGRHYSSNDSDYSTENESLYGIDKLKKSDAHYLSNESVKSSAYSSSSSVPCSESFAKHDLARARIKSESSEDEPMQRKIKQISLKEVHAESDEDAKSDSSNSTLADSSSSSESEIILASGIVIKREKFTSGSEFDSSADSTEDSQQGEKGSWYMTVKEHRASSPNQFSEEPVEKEIFFKFKNARKGLYKEEVPECAYLAIERVEIEGLEKANKPLLKRPTPVRPKESMSVSDSEEIALVTKDKSGPTTISRSPPPTDLESVQSVAILEGELEDISESSISLTHISTLDGSLTQTNLFTLPPLGKHSPDLDDIKSHCSSESDCNQGVSTPYHLVRQILKQNEALFKLQEQGKLHKLVSYSSSSLSSISESESLVSLIGGKEPSGLTPQYFYDSRGNKKHVMVSAGTSTTFGTGVSHSLDEDSSGVSNLTSTKMKNDQVGRSFFNQRGTQTPSDIASMEVVLLDTVPRKQKFLDSVGTQTDGVKRPSLLRQPNVQSAFAFTKPSVVSDSLGSDESKTPISITKSVTLQKSSPEDPDGTLKDQQNFVTLHTEEKQLSVFLDTSRVGRKVPMKSFAYKKKSDISPLDSSTDSNFFGQGAQAEERMSDQNLAMPSKTESIISFHECEEEMISASDPLESLSSDQSSSSSVTEELRVSLKLSRDLSKSDSSMSDLDSTNENLTLSKEEDQSANNSDKPLNKSCCIASTDKKEILEVIDRVEEIVEAVKSRKITAEMLETTPTAGSFLLNKDSSESSGEISSKDTLVSAMFNKTLTSDETTTRGPQEVSEYSVGEVISGCMTNAAPMISTTTESTNTAKSSTKDQKSTSVDKYLLYLRDKSSSTASSMSVEKDESDFEKLHREMKDIFDKESLRIVSQRNSSASNSTLRNIPSIDDSDLGMDINSKTGMYFKRGSSTDESNNLDRDWQDDEDEEKTVLEARTHSKISGHSLMGKVSATLCSYGTVSDPEAISSFPNLNSSSNGAEESTKLLRNQSGSTRSRNSVPRLTNLSTTNQKYTDIGISVSHTTSYRGSSTNSCIHDMTSDIRTSAYSSKLRTTSGGHILSGRSLVDYADTLDTLSSEDELSPDELDDLVYSLQFTKPESNHGEDLGMYKFCGTCKSAVNCTCEASNSCEDSVMADSAKKTRWKDDYGVVRALKLIFCPCRDA